MAETVSDLVLLGLDRLQVRQAEGVDLIGVRVERRLHSDRQPIRGVAAGRCRDARLRPGVGLVLVREVVAQAAQRRRRSCSSTTSATRGRSSSLTWAIVVAGRSAGGHRQQPLDLLDRSPHRDGRGGAAVGDALGQRADVLVDQRRVAALASEQALEALRGVGRLVLRDLGGPDLRSGSCDRSPAGTASAPAPRAGSPRRGSAGRA